MKKIVPILLCIALILNTSACVSQSTKSDDSSVVAESPEASTLIVGEALTEEAPKAMTDDYENADLYVGYGEDPSAEKTVITIGTLNQSSLLESVVSQFNASSDTYEAQIQIYDDRSVLNTAILGGNGPDVIYLSGFPYLQYIQRDIFLDLSDILDTAEDYEPVVRELIRGNFADKISVASYKFEAISTSKTRLEGKTTWTFDDFLKVAETMNIYQKRTKSYVLSYYLEKNLDEYVNVSTNTCDFECEEFYTALEFLNRFLDSESQIVDDGEIADVIFSAGIPSVELLYPIYGATTFYEDTYYLGFPSNSGHQISISAQISFAIPYSTKHEAVAREFVAFSLSTEFQTKIVLGFPVNHSAMIELIHTTFSDTYFDEYADADEVAVATVTDLLDRTTDITYTDTTITDIIEEEVASYFNGDKAAEAVAELIQSRVQIYLDEQS